MLTQKKIGVVGRGALGVAVAQALTKQGLANDIVVVGVEHEGSDDQVTRLIQRHSPVGGVSVREGTCEHLEGAELVVVASHAWDRSDDDTREGSAGRGGLHDADRAPAPRAWARNSEASCGQRAQHLNMLRHLVHGLDTYVPDVPILVAAEPVDMLTFVIQEMSARPVGQVLGLGTLPDTLRFKKLLGEHYGVHESSIDALIIGVHGRSEIPLWSQISVGGHSVLRGQLLGRLFQASHMWNLFEKGRCETYRTCKVVAPEVREALCLVVSSILQDERRVLPVSTRLRGALAVSGVCLSLPCVVGRNGIHDHILPDLSSEEQEALQMSASALKRRVRRLKQKEEVDSFSAVIMTEERVLA